MKQINTVLLAILVAIIGVVSFVGVKQVNRRLDLQAIHDCSQDYRQEFNTGETTKVSRPLEQQVKECAWNKGVRGWVGIWSGLPKTK
jgi:hypothetical protein